MRPLCLLALLAACGGNPGQPDLAVPADLRIPALPDLAQPAVPDLAPIACFTPLEPCPVGNNYVCNQFSQCAPCGLQGQDCCMSDTGNFCTGAGLHCVGCGTGSPWGNLTRCSADACGKTGQPCCLEFAAQFCLAPTENCSVGSCMNHVCQ